MPFGVNDGRRNIEKHKETVSIFFSNLIPDLLQNGYKTKNSIPL
ncbi:hypothetical protein LEP1GSC017_2701 [Leptospira meyeri serovar Hardjo str. Went 5]|nr:hypothetical protein LEP1GSC017_2701 [Leptospira meyeri serovar Hardjo str. Went 5]EMJ85833.1 hypothetical protein LEP1GSC196_0322 [Leptospira meyeri serovar Semaranga str. Veldrot Semarang 173]